MRLAVRERPRRGIGARPAEPVGGRDEQDQGAVGRRALDPIGVELAELATAASAERRHCAASRSMTKVSPNSAIFVQPLSARVIASSLLTALRPLLGSLGPPRATAIFFSFS